jgi:hypothetical protein
MILGDGGCEMRTLGETMGSHKRGGARILRRMLIIRVTRFCVLEEILKEWQNPICSGTMQNIE